MYSHIHLQINVISYDGRIFFIRLGWVGSVMINTVTVLYTGQKTVLSCMQCLFGETACTVACPTGPDVSISMMKVSFQLYF